MASATTTAPPARSRGSAVTSSNVTTSSSSSPATNASRQRIAQPNGSVRNKGKPSPDISPITTSALTTPSGDNDAHNRLLFLLANLVGLPVVITVRTNERFSGIFSGVALESPETRYTTKMTKRLSSSANDEQSNGADSEDEYVGYGENYVKTFAPSDVTDLYAANVTFDKMQTKIAPGIAGRFQTDTDISGNRSGGQLRELQPWLPSEETAPGLTLNGSASGGWDQFETNANLFGVRSDYDETLYTTAIDKSHPTYSQRVAAAERKAREIEGDSLSHLHRAADENNDDEEAAFSGVRRDPQTLPSSSANKYTLPARRAPTGQPTIAGAPVDPAIISSQLVRPNAVSGKGSRPIPPTSSSASASNATSGKENAVPIPADSAIGSGQPAQATNEPSVTTEQNDHKTPLVKDSGYKPSAISVPAKETTRNATETVEKDLLGAFKAFSTQEKRRINNKKNMLQLHEKESKINDLRRFSATFRLNTEVPQDMLGILAKDRAKQEEIVAKSRKDIEFQAQEKKDANANATSSSATAGTSTPTSTPSTEATVASSAAPPAVPTAPRSENEKSIASGPSDLPPRRRGPARGPHGFANERNIAAYSPRGPMAPNTFGQNLVQRYPRPPPPGMATDMRIPPGPPAIKTEVNMPRGSGLTLTPGGTGVPSTLNVTASEFRPNPTASLFSPVSGSKGSNNSQVAAASVPVSKSQSPTKRTFFSDRKPMAPSERKSLREGFNPIARMKKEAALDDSAKNYSNNDGIPPAFTMKPSWDVPDANIDLSYVQMFDHAMLANSNVPLNGSMAHQHQLPPQYQQGTQLPPQMPTGQPMTRFPGPYPTHPAPRGDPSYDEHRMQYSYSASSAHQSPRAQPGVIFAQSPLPPPAQPYMPQGVPQYPSQHGQPMFYRQPSNGPYQQVYNPQTGQMQMMVPVSGSGPPGGQYMMPMQPQQQPQQHAYHSPAQAQSFPVHGGPQTPGAYGSPRPPMMPPQGNFQGQAPMMHMSGSAQGQQPMYYWQPQQGPPMSNVRPGPPMHQTSFGNSPHPSHHYPVPGRGHSHPYGSFPPQPQGPPPHGMGPHTMINRATSHDGK